MASLTVAIVLGSESDLPTMNHGVEKLREFGIEHEVQILSAHRKPKKLTDYVNTLEQRGVRVVIAGAGGAAHLPGVIAAQTQLPVLGVPMELQKQPLTHGL